MFFDTTPEPKNETGIFLECYLESCCTIQQIALLLDAILSCNSIQLGAILINIYTEKNIENARSFSYIIWERVFFPYVHNILERDSVSSQRTREEFQPTKFTDPYLIPQQFGGRSFRIVTVDRHTSSVTSTKNIWWCRNEMVFLNILCLQES